MDERKVNKEAGCSWIHIKNKVPVFVASDQSHPLSNLIYKKLEEMTARLKDAGYRPNIDLGLYEVEEEQKESMLACHSERLAIAFPLVASPQGIPLQIVKNLRVCGNCHTVTKMVSKMEGREIIVRNLK